MMHASRPLGFLVFASAVLASSTAFAGPFTFVRIGDKDGFGFGSTGGLVRATNPPNTTAADTNGNNLLEQTEFLPDLNKNGIVATGQGDDFDNRSAAEKGNTAPLGGDGFTDTGSTGSKWTDISLSTSFTGPDFPDVPPGNGTPVPTEAEFIYDFDVFKADIVAGADLFFNVVFGDYDVSPANITLTFASAASRTLPLTLQSNASDGLIQASSTFLNFNEVFTDGGTVWNGYLKVKFVGPNEPYTAFDYTELSRTQIPTTVPDAGSTAFLLAGGLAGLAGAARRVRRG